jgi:4-hydroxybenzoate polyprenyltransferase
MLSRFIARVEAMDISFGQWVAGFLGIIFIRFFLENLSSPTRSFPSVPDALTLIHYGLFYLTAILLTAIIIRIAVPDIAAISKFLLFIFPITWLPPIVDFITSHGSGSLMAYVFDAGPSLWGRFLTLGGSAALGGITLGIKIELVIIVVGIFFYVFIKTKNIGKAVAIAALSYCAVFFLIALPSFLALGGGGFSPSTALLSLFSSSHAAQNFIRPTVQVSYGYALESVFNLGMAQFYFLFDFVLVCAWMLLYRPRIVRAFLKNIRLGRVIHYMVMIIAGGLLAMSIRGVHFFLNWSDGIAFSGLLLAYVCAWMFAVGVNDLADIPIDRISNSGRPLVTGALSASDVRSGNIFFLTWFLLGGFLGGYWAFFTIATFTAAYYVYSAHPLRLKQIPILATFLISLACLSATMAGFYFVSDQKLLFDFPIRVIILVVICFTLGVNIKDIKDIKGDRAVGVSTLPVVFGERVGKPAVGGLFALSFLAVPAVLGSWPLFIPSFIAATAGYFLIIMEPYKEWRVFILYFCYLAVVGIMLWPR